MKRNKKLAVKIGQKKNNWTMFMSVAIHTDLNDIHKKILGIIYSAQRDFGLFVWRISNSIRHSSSKVPGGRLKETFSLSMPKVLITTTSKNKNFLLTRPMKDGNIQTY